MAEIDRKLAEDLHGGLDDMEPPSDKALENPKFPVIEIYEQDWMSGNPQRRLIQRVATAEDRKKVKKIGMMIEESERNPDYDDTELNHMLMDSLIQNPEFADLKHEIRQIKKEFIPKAEMKAIQEQYEKEEDEEIRQLQEETRNMLQGALQDLIDDPDLDDARKDLLELQSKLPEIDDLDNADFQAAVDSIIAKLDNNEKFQEKMATFKESESFAQMQANHDAVEKEMKELQPYVDDINKEVTEDDLNIDSDEDFEKVEKEMDHVLRVLKREFNYEPEPDPFDDDAGEAPDDAQLDEAITVLGREVSKAVATHTGTKVPEPIEEGLEDDEENLTPEEKAKVDEILQDPGLMRNIMQVYQALSEQKTNIIYMPIESAPDPETLDESELATLRQQMQVARKDPEHVAALRRLRVKLPPPFNVSPQLKKFNQAIQLAYVGANDQVRRHLWRSYQKARMLPTFLQCLSDDAWDLLYYSQTVNWETNRNRADHLKALLKDLKKVGRDGPPTHPSTFLKNAS